MEKIISGKVREVYDVGGGRLVIYTTDRVSAYDVVLRQPVPGKGRVLNAVSRFWFDYTKDLIPNHIISCDQADMPGFEGGEYAGRVALVKRLKMLPYEFIVRGYIFGNMYKAYQEGREFCGIKIEGDYKQAQRLPEPLFTPSTKAEQGAHDEYISFGRLGEGLGAELAEKTRSLSIAVYKKCYDYALSKGIIIADTKFEFGLDEDGVLTLADEALTPDSSRFWSAAEYQAGTSPKSYDKQALRDWLAANAVNGAMPFDAVPDAVLAETAAIYAECERRICGE